MSIGKTFLAEVLQEAANTRKLIASLPFDKADFKPHERSMSLKSLAIHITEINGWWKECLINDVLDFSVGDFSPKVINSTEELLALHDDLIEKSTKILNNVADDEFYKPWTMRNGDIIYFTMPKIAVVRTWCLNHLFHHRGQLTVYLRLLDVKLSGMYGPTADDNKNI